MAKKEDVADAVSSMKRLNNKSSEIFKLVGVNACTDITGFSLIGHSFEIAEKSGVCLKIYTDKLSFVSGAVQYAEDWLFPGGTSKNMKFYGKSVEFDSKISEEMQSLLFTPETSGGLLASVPAEKTDRLLELFSNAKEECRIIGDVCKGKGIKVTK